MKSDFEQLKEEIINTLSRLKAGEYVEHPVLSRPGATILEATVGKHRWYCERPKYFWTTLDQSFLAKSYEDEGRLHKFLPKNFGLKWSKNILGARNTTGVFR